jgi:hypothetical protein
MTLASQGLSGNALAYSTNWPARVGRLFVTAGLNTDFVRRGGPCLPDTFDIQRRNEASSRTGDAAASADLDGPLEPMGKRLFEDWRPST